MKFPDCVILLVPRTQEIAVWAAEASMPGLTHRDKQPKSGAAQTEQIADYAHVATGKAARRA
jgi:hypothetical protein